MPPERKIIKISIVSGIVVLALISFLIYSLFRGIKRGSEEFAAVKKDLFLSQGKTGGLEQIKEDYEGLKPDLEKIEGLFIDPQLPINLMQFWEETARDSGLSIDISALSLKAPETNSWPSMGFQIGLTGSFPNFLKFLEKIENTSYLIEIQSLIIRGLTREELKLIKYGHFSLGDVRVTLLTKVFTK